MAKYVVVNPKAYDKVCDTYTEAQEFAYAQKGNWSIYCAPDKNKAWRHGHPVSGECWVLHMGEPVRARYVQFETKQDKCINDGMYRFVGYNNVLQYVDKTDGWLPLDWFRYFEADDEAMQYWQMEDEYADSPYDNYDYEYSISM